MSKTIPLIGSMLYENSLSHKTLSVNEHINLTDSFKISWSRVRKKPVKSKGQVVMHVDFGPDFHLLKNDIIYESTLY